jgi:vacuolar-type H+-ATPase subunit H
MTIYGHLRRVSKAIKSDQKRSKAVRREAPRSAEKCSKAIKAIKSDQKRSEEKRPEALRSAQKRSKAITSDQNHAKSDKRQPIAFRGTPADITPSI